MLHQYCLTKSCKHLPWNSLCFEAIHLSHQPHCKHLPWNSLCFEANHLSHEPHLLNAENYLLPVTANSWLIQSVKTSSDSKLLTHTVCKDIKTNTHSFYWAHSHPQPPVSHKTITNSIRHTLKPYFELCSKSTPWCIWFFNSKGKNTRRANPKMTHIQKQNYKKTTTGSYVS